MDLNFEFIQENCPTIGELQKRCAEMGFNMKNPSKRGDSVKQMKRRSGSLQNSFSLEEYSKNKIFRQHIKFRPIRAEDLF